jgi:hypothetical protein
MNTSPHSQRRMRRWRRRWSVRACTPRHTGHGRWGAGAAETVAAVVPVGWLAAMRCGKLARPPRAVKPALASGLRTGTPRRAISPPGALRVTGAGPPGDPRAQKAILFFLAPAEVKGTGFLAFTHKGRPADQWLYLPELKRVRQITARRRKESFVGTDLSYHDLDLIQEWRRGRRPTRARASVPRR